MFTDEILISTVNVSHSQSHFEECIGDVVGDARSQEFVGEVVARRLARGKGLAKVLRMGSRQRDVAYGDVANFRSCR